MSRYAVEPFPRGTLYGIWDRVLQDFCGLPLRTEPEGPAWWLQWSTPEQAQAWLNDCYRTWATWPPGHGAPEGYGSSKPCARCDGRSGSPH